jgi:deoxyadenosine/deoxycytidine kinase
MPRVALEGLIGAGKSTLIQRLGRGHPEPVEQWTFLADFYHDPARWAFPLQMQILLSQTNSPPDGLFERSPHSALHVFARDSLTPPEWDLLSAWSDRCGWVPDEVVFLRVPPATCLERVRRRNRPGEEGITLDFLCQLERKYDGYLDYCRAQGIPVRVIEQDQTI